MQWDIFCRVIDNLGDIGVCWRLAADLASRGERVRLWADDVSALAWMAPEAGGVEVLHWDACLPALEPADVVVEAFGCDPPEDFVRRMARRQQPPVWINLEYLSAEPYVERSHRLPSPVSHGAGAGLTKWFFYPGFTARTGGLLREDGLLRAAQRWRDEGLRGAWLARHAVAPLPQERVVTLFCYERTELAGLLDELRERPALLLVPPGQPARTMARATGCTTDVGSTVGLGRSRMHFLPFLNQAGFDRLLWSADLNFVRGEDSFVRAQWAGCPFVWQIYLQEDGAHVAKLDAFLDRMLVASAREDACALRTAWHAWNGLAPWQGGFLEAVAASAPLCEAWRSRLAGQPDLCTNLQAFARSRMPVGTQAGGVGTNPG